MTGDSGHPEFSSDRDDTGAATGDERTIERVTQLQRLADEVRYAQGRVEYAYSLLPGDAKGKDDKRLRDFLEVMDGSLSAIQRWVALLLSREPPELNARHEERGSR